MQLSRVFCTERMLLMAVHRWSTALVPPGRIGGWYMREQFLTLAFVLLATLFSRTTGSFLIERKYAEPSFPWMAAVFDNEGVAAVAMSRILVEMLPYELFDFSADLKAAAETLLSVFIVCLQATLAWDSFKSCAILYMHLFFRHQFVPFALVLPAAIFCQEVLLPDDRNRATITTGTILVAALVLYFTNILLEFRYGCRMRLVDPAPVRLCAFTLCLIHQVLGFINYSDQQQQLFYYISSREAEALRVRSKLLPCLCVGFSLVWHASRCRCSVRIPVTGGLISALLILLGDLAGGINGVSLLVGLQTVDYISSRAVSLWKAHVKFMRDFRLAASRCSVAGQVPVLPLDAWHYYQKNWGSPHFFLPLDAQLRANIKPIVRNDRFKQEFLLEDTVETCSCCITSMPLY